MFSFLYNLIIEPIVIVYELVYGITEYYIFYTPITEEIIVCILVVSIVFNLLTYPLYKKADELQNEARNKKDKMSKWVNHIKKNFKGDERYFILSTYYKENNYSPFDQIKESLSLLIQIPFFAAAYIFFTSIDYTNKTAFGVIPFGAEDALLNIGGGVSINVLPIFMTIINFISACVYTKGFKLKDKISSFILPIVFLIILYRSPSALVIYWTFNNIISLIKNIILKNKHTKELNEDKKLVNDNANTEIENKKNNINVLWVTTSIFLFLAIVIPTQVIKSSPEEFDSIYYSLYSFILYTVNVFLGFAIWTLVFYHFANNKKKFVYVFTIINIFMIINHMLYVNDGLVTTMLKFGVPIEFPIFDIILNIVYLLVTIISIKLISKRFDIVSLVVRAMCISFALWSMINIFQITRSMKVGENSGNKKIEINNEPNTEFLHKLEDKDIAEDIFDWLDGKKAYIKYMDGKEYNSSIEDGSKPIVNISKNGKNVIFICFDRFIGRYYEYAVAIMPEIREKLEGFKVYTNTFSFGPRTVVGTPGLYGGYEYQPYESNKRDEELVVKHNEAITLMPKMFSDEGYNVTTMDIPYENYYDVTRESVWKDLHNVKNVHMEDSIKSKIIDDNIYNTHEVIKERFIYYTIVKIAPLLFKAQIYNQGSYLHTFKVTSYKERFLQSYAILDSMNQLCDIIDDDSNNVLIYHNYITHEEAMLNYPDFYPDGSQWDNSYMDGVKNKNGQEFLGDKEHLNNTIAALSELTKFFDYLKKNDVYDNTRIIIVSDHGAVRDNEFDHEFTMGKVDEETLYPQDYNAILMYKDFNAKGYEESDELMSNADAPYLALNGISKTMKNPWSGKELTMDYKKEKDKMYLIGIVKTSPSYFLGRNKFHPESGDWIIFTGNKVLSNEGYSIDLIMEKNSCLRGANHDLVRREKLDFDRCGTNYLMDMYECSICGKCFKDEGAVERIENPEQYMYDVPHKFTNYISDNNDSENNHGTKTAECDYGCGTKNTIYDDSVNMHHHFVKTTKKANLNEDGYIGSACDKCHLIEPGKTAEVIPALKEVKLESEYVEMTGNKNNARVVGIDKEGNEISDDNIEAKYFDNDNLGNAYAIVTLKNHYELLSDDSIRLDYKIVPGRVKIKSIEHKRSNLIVSIELGKGRINDVEIVVDDKEDKLFTFKKTEKNEYKVNLTDFNNEAKKIKVRVVRYDNTTGEALYSPWVEEEVK